MVRKINSVIIYIIKWYSFWLLSFLMYHWCNHFKWSCHLPRQCIGSLCKKKWLHLKKKLHSMRQMKILLKFYQSIWKMKHNQTQRPNTEPLTLPMYQYIDVSRGPGPATNFGGWYRLLLLQSNWAAAKSSLHLKEWNNFYCRFKKCCELKIIHNAITPSYYSPMKA